GTLVGDREVHLIALLTFGRLSEFLGVPTLHARPAGQQPDGGAEALGGTSLVEFVITTEPHRHQVGGPGPDDGCVDEAAAAHVSYGRGVYRGPYAKWRGVSHDLADISTVFCDCCDWRSRERPTDVQKMPTPWIKSNIYFISAE